jgi:hypothetical protein
VLRGERVLGVRAIPRVAEVLEVAARRGDRRELGDLGRRLERRSTPAWQSQLLADTIWRSGTSAPRSRAKPPTTKSRPSAHGRSSAPAGSSPANEV